MFYFKLYTVFFKVGLFAIGGGLATLPFLQQIVYKYGWITSEELLNMIAISESTPGPIGINTATFVGNRTLGIPGGILATLGVITPSIIIIILISKYFSKFKEEDSVEAAFKGIRPAVTGLLTSVGVDVAFIALLNTQLYEMTGNILDLFELKSLLLFLFVFYLMRVAKKHPIFIIFMAGIIGVIFKF